MATFKASALRPSALWEAQQDRIAVKEITFKESDGSAAGVYTGSIEVPGGAYIVDIVVHNEALWTAGTSATLKIGDSANDDGFFTAVNLKATDMLAAESVNFAQTGSKEGADLDGPAAGAHVRRRYLPNTRTISGVVTTVGTVGTAGITRLIVVYARPSTVKEASFVAT